MVRSAVLSAAQQPQRDPLRNARLFAAVFWRPATAIRNADRDGHDATQREASWAPLIDAPLHPEYPSGHSILAAAVAEVIGADTKALALPALATSSPAAKGATRRWNRLDEFVREVSDARVHGGIHFRSATDAGEAMGNRIGELAAAKVLGGAD